MNYFISEHNYCASIRPLASPDQPDHIQLVSPGLPDEKESSDSTKIYLNLSGQLSNQQQQVQHEDSIKIDQVKYYKIFCLY